MKYNKSNVNHNKIDKMLNDIGRMKLQNNFTFNPDKALISKPQSFFNRQSTVIIASISALLVVAVIIMIVFSSFLNYTKSELKTAGKSEPELLEKYVTVQYNNAKEVESMTDDELIKFATQNIRFIIPGFYAREDLGVPLKGSEYWGSISPSSASSVAEATNKIKEFGFVKDAVSYTIEYIGENKYYYSFRITWLNDLYWDNQNKQELATYTNRYLVYKESVKHYPPNPNTWTDIKFNMLDKQSILELLDLSVSVYYDSWFSQVVYRDFEETDNEYIYTYYRIGDIGGDWGMSDTATLEKTVERVDKKTGRYTSSFWMHEKTQTLKEVIVPSTYHPGSIENQ